MFSAFNTESSNRGRQVMPVAFSESKDSQPSKICVVSQPDDASFSLRELTSVLVGDGNDVTWIELPSDETHKSSLNGAQCSQHIRLAELYKITQNFLPVQAACVYDWLRRYDFDIVIFHHGYGAGYYACMARQIGLAFLNTPMVISASMPIAQRLEKGMRFPETYQHFEQNFVERETVAKADAVLCQSQDIFQWIEETGWSVPPNFAVRETSGTSAMAITEWLTKLKTGTDASAELASSQESIFISVCLATYNRPELLKEALHSLSAQTCRDFEVIVVDDGSQDAGVAETKTELASLFHERGWRWETQVNKGPSAARNYAASLAQGSHLLFMDDDNLAYPEELERFAVAAKSGIDILTCFLGTHPGSAMSFQPVAILFDNITKQIRPLGWIPLGNCLELAPFINRMGDTNCLIRRQTFLTLGGFQGSREMVLEDFEFFIRASLAGFTIAVVPEILVLYRRGKHSRSMGQTIFRSHVDSLMPIAKILPAPFRNLLLAVRGEWYKRHCSRRDGDQGVTR